ncbi:MAG: hypothetical protein K2K44_04805 [Oscillospiraceae bacterium]|nr:hypothetical protein [Oscillospiraceae bacterium]
MNIKKVTAAIFTLIAVVLIIGAATILFITSRDEIVISTEVPNIDVGMTLISHEMKSGNSVELLVSAEASRAAAEDDDLYRIRVVLFEQKENKAYSVENASFKINFDTRAEIISRYCSGGGGEYYIPEIDYREAGKQVVCCDFDGDYAEIDIIAKLSSPSEIPMLFTYDISGKGLNSLNGFPDQSCEIMISCY